MYSRRVRARKRLPCAETVEHDPRLRGSTTLRKGLRTTGARQEASNRWYCVGEVSKVTEANRAFHLFSVSAK
mgnify:CR=1 FL=1